MKITAILLALLLLFGCAVSEPALSTEVTEPAEEVIEEPVFEETEEEPKPTEIEYSGAENKRPQTAVFNYFNALYDSYIAMLPVDISKTVDLDFEIMENIQNWNTLLAMRRSIIFEKGYCYVETERFPFSISYISKKDLDDQRMDYVNMKDFGEGAVALHFVINGEKGKAYPPIFAVNSQHTMILTLEDGVYKIAYHYFPGSEGKFQNDLPVTLMEREEMEALLEEAFAPVEDFEIPEAKFERLYNGEAAAEYALLFCEEPNPEFSFVGDWYGNCMNFASQCIWSGFRTEEDTARNYGSMTKKWYSGKSGGSLIWASVSRFWNWTQEETCGMQIYTFYDPAKVEKGDLVHIGSYVCETEEKYAHALFVVDPEKMVFAQNSPACFVYYSDLVNNYAKFIQPVSLKA